MYYGKIAKDCGHNFYLNSLMISVGHDHLYIKNLENKNGTKKTLQIDFYFQVLIYRTKHLQMWRLENTLIKYQRQNPTCLHLKQLMAYQIRGHVRT